MEEIINSLKKLKLMGMIECLEQEKALEDPNIPFEEKLVAMIRTEEAYRATIRNNRLLRQSKLRIIPPHLLISDQKRGLDSQTLSKLMSLEFLKEKRNVMITGATGCGKTYLASGIGTQACVKGYVVRFMKIATLIEEMQMSRELGYFKKFFNQLTKVDLLILDHFGPSFKATNYQLNDLLNLIDQRDQKKSTMMISQLPVSHWHQYFGGDCLADALLDRLLAGSIRVELKGESLRQVKK